MPTPLSQPADACILFLGERGEIRHVSGILPEGLQPRQALAGRYLWDVLSFPFSSMQEIETAYPYGGLYGLNDTLPENGLQFRLFHIPPSVTPDGGWVVQLSLPTPLVELRESYQDEVGEKIQAWGDSVALFEILFEESLDATLLADEGFTVLAANPQAKHIFRDVRDELVGLDIRNLIPPDAPADTDDLMRLVREEDGWSGRMSVSAGGGELPARVHIRQVELSDYTLYHCIIRDLTVRKRLEEGLQAREEEVQDMSIALKKVIQAVEEEKQDAVDEIAQQVRDQVLPAVERLAETPYKEQRQRYKRVIKTQIAEIVDNSVEGLDALAMLLTPRELEICHEIRQGRTGREIAETLDITFETLQTHRKNIRRKLGLRGKPTSLTSYLITLSIP